MANRRLKGQGRLPWAMDKEPRGPAPSLLKSAVQKSIRANRPDVAIRAMKALVLRDTDAAVRRLPILVLEDAVLHPAFAELVQFCSLSATQILADRPTRNLLLQVVGEIAACEWRDAPPKGNPEMSRASREAGAAAREALAGDPVLSGAHLITVEAIRERARLGGMRSDVGMLYDYSDLWSVRFAEQSWSLDRCGTFFVESEVEWEDVEPLRNEEIPLEAVDQHCSPMSRMLLRRPRLLEAVSAAYPTEEPEKVVDAVLWHCRGSVSKKPCLHSQRGLDRFVDYDDWTPRWGADGPAKFAGLFDMMREDVDRLATWWLTGRKERRS